MPTHPFAIPAPRGQSTLSEEASLYSSTAEPSQPTRGRSGVQGNADAARARMLGGRVPTDVEVDALGEADVLDRAAAGVARYDGADNEEAAEQRQDDDINLRDDGEDFDIEAEVQRRVGEELARRTQQSAPSRTQAPHVTAAAVPQTHLAVHPVQYADTDRLWDWLRVDTQGGHQFFARTFATSVDLHKLMHNFADAEVSMLGMMRAIHIEGGPQAAHVGFVMLAPILVDERLAMAHIYLRPDARNRLRQMVPPLLQLAQQQMPNFKIGVLPGDDAQRRFYESLLLPHGFTAHTVLVR